MKEIVLPDNNHSQKTSLTLFFYLFQSLTSGHAGALLSWVFNGTNLLGTDVLKLIIYSLLASFDNLLSYGDINEPKVQQMGKGAANTKTHKPPCVPPTQVHSYGPKDCFNHNSLLMEIFIPLLPAYFNQSALNSLFIIMTMETFSVLFSIRYF